MIYERSAGVIPFRRIDDEIQYLLLHSLMVRNPDAAWEFPKGSLEIGEEPLEAALRELGEEANIMRIELIDAFRDEVHYTYRRGGREIEKIVTFFTGEVKNWSMIPDDAPTREHGPHPKEGTWHVWVTENEAQERLFHPGMRQLLSRSSFFLHEHDRILRRQRPPKQ